MWQSKVVSITAYKPESAELALETHTDSLQHLGAGGRKPAPPPPVNHNSNLDIRLLGLSRPAFRWTWGNVLYRGWGEKYLNSDWEYIKKKSTTVKESNKQILKRGGTFIKATVLFLNATWVDCIRKDAPKLKQPGLKMMVAGWKYLHFPGGL